MPEFQNMMLVVLQIAEILYLYWFWYRFTVIFVVFWVSHVYPEMTDWYKKEMTKMLQISNFQVHSCGILSFSYKCSYNSDSKLFDPESKTSLRSCWSSPGSINLRRASLQVSSYQNYCPATRTVVLVSSYQNCCTSVQLPELSYWCPATRTVVLVPNYQNCCSTVHLPELSY